MEQESTELGTEDKLAVHIRIEQRLFADAIAREKQFLSSFVPNRKRKHSAQVFRTVNAELIVGMNDGFGVAVGVESVAEFF